MWEKYWDQELGKWGKTISISGDELRRINHGGWPIWEREIGMMGLIFKNKEDVLLYVVDSIHEFVKIWCDMLLLEGVNEGFYTTILLN